MGMQTDTVLSFGLGACAEANVDVRWPNQELSKQTFLKVAASKLQELRQGDAQPHDVLKVGLVLLGRHAIRFVAGGRRAIPDGAPGGSP
jgi:hypothetical protein